MVLELKNVSAGYGRHDVLHEISCVFPDRSCWCILGPNGCGKTTLLRAMAGLIPHRGEVLLDGIETGTLRRRAMACRIAVMSQINTVYFPYTVYDTVMLGRYRTIRKGLFGTPSHEDHDAVERCLQFTGLQEFRNRELNELSGGQLQRVFLARVLAQDPDILLLDEPTNHLDVRYQVELIDYLRHWSAEGGHTVIGVLHDLNLALRLSLNTVFLQDGRIAGHGDFRDVADAQFLRSVYGMDLAGYMQESFRLWQDI